MNTVLIVLIVLGSLSSLVELFLMSCPIILKNNLRKYGNEWGKLPKWLYRIIDTVVF
jgi:hypothetical protein